MQTLVTRYRSRFAATTCILLAGCATQPSARQTDEGDRVVLQVTNVGTQELDIYALAEGASRERIGTAPTAGRTEIALPRRFWTGALALVAVPVGGRDQARPWANPGPPYISREIHVQPGDRIQWRLENILALSTLCVTRVGGPERVALDQGSC